MKIGLKVAVLLSGIAGTVVALASYGFIPTLLYFTNMSNILAAVVAGIFLYFEIAKKEVKPFFHTLRFIATSGIALTFVVFTTILMPSVILQGYPSYLYSANNIFLHNLTPILMMLDYMLYARKEENIKSLYALIFPIGYLIFSLALNPLTGVLYDGGLKVPYFFLDFYNNGWFTLNQGFLKIGTFWWLLLVIPLSSLIGYVLIIIRRKFGPYYYNEDKLEEVTNNAN